MTAYFNNDYINGSFNLINNSKIDFFVNSTKLIDRITVQYRFDVKILGVDSRLSDSTEYSNFMQKTFDICNFLKNPMQTDPIAYLFYKLVPLSKNSKLFNKCPIPPVIV